MDLNNHLIQRNNTDIYNLLSSMTINNLIRENEYYVSIKKKRFSPDKISLIDLTNNQTIIYAIKGKKKFKIYYNNKKYFELYRSKHNEGKSGYMKFDDYMFYICYCKQENFIMFNMSNDKENTFCRTPFSNLNQNFRDKYSIIEYKNLFDTNTNNFLLKSKKINDNVYKINFGKPFCLLSAFCLQLIVI